MAGSPAGAYPGAPWFEPGETYDQNFPDPSATTGAPYCVSQGQRRMSVATAAARGTNLTVLGDARPPPPPARGIDLACPRGKVPPAGFGDVSSTSVHRDAIDCVVWWEVAQGTGPGRYEPGQVVTRAQMATFLVRAADRAGVELEGGGDVFSDDDRSVHEANIDAAAAAGLTGGRADGTYGPGLAVRRARMGSFLARLLDVFVEEDVVTVKSG